MIKQYRAYYTNDLGYDYPADLAESEGGDLVQYADHAALIAKVREVAENMPHAEGCDAISCGCMECGLWLFQHQNDDHAFSHAPCSDFCPRGNLLEVINGRD